MNTQPDRTSSEGRSPIRSYGQQASAKKPNVKDLTRSQVNRLAMEQSRAIDEMAEHLNRAHSQYQNAGHALIWMAFQITELAEKNPDVFTEDKQAADLLSTSQTIINNARAASHGDQEQDDQHDQAQPEVGEPENRG